MVLGCTDKFACSSGSMQTAVNKQQTGQTKRDNHALKERGKV